MRITVIELPAVHGEPEAQLERADALLAAGPPCDVALLPECSITGYVSGAGDYDLTRFAEALEGRTAKALAALAKKHATHLVGPLVEKAEGGPFNSTVGFLPNGERFLHYRKRHPWYSETWASKGTDPHPLVTIRGRALTIATCFDIHFLEEAVPVLRRAEVLLFPSAWVEAPGDEGPQRAALLEGVARVYGVVIANANWGVGKPLVAGQGGSMIVDAEGRTLTRVSPPQPTKAGGRADAMI